TFCKLQIPVTVVVPEERVYTLDVLVEFVIVEGLCRAVDGFGETSKNPVVLASEAVEGHLAVGAGVLFRSQILRHLQDETGCVPQLVDEIAIAADALAVDLDGAALTA